MPLRHVLKVIPYVLLMLVAAPAARADTPEIRVAVLKFGTVNWLMETISARGLDTAEGVRLSVVPLAGGAATKVAFQSGDADMLVADWVWALKQRARGRDLTFAPYSTALGAMVGRDGVADLCALKGRPVGVVGGGDDKSWILMQAVVRQECGFDLAAETEALFGAPPLMSRQLQDGTVDAVSTYWHFVARLEANGMTPLMRVDEAMARLGIDPAPPMIGFIWDKERANPAAVDAFLRAVVAAGRVLATDDTAWEAIRPLMRAKSDAEFSALRDAYRRGIPGPWTAADTESAQRLYDVLTAQAGKAFTETAGPFDPAVFPAR